MIERINNHRRYVLLTLASSTLTTLAAVGLVLALSAHSWLLAAVAVLIGIGSVISTVTSMRLVRANVENRRGG